MGARVFFGTGVASGMENAGGKLHDLPHVGGGRGGGQDGFGKRAARRPPGETAMGQGRRLAERPGAKLL